jgi:hypothetical protein
MRFWPDFWQSLVAILFGNLVYFLLEPHLPVAAQHQLYRPDLGMLVDFSICVAAWVAVTWLTRLGSRDKS